MAFLEEMLLNCYLNLQKCKMLYGIFNICTFLKSKDYIHLYSKRVIGRLVVTL